MSVFYCRAVGAHAEKTCTGGEQVQGVAVAVGWGEGSSWTALSRSSWRRLHLSGPWKRDSGDSGLTPGIPRHFSRVKFAGPAEGLSGFPSLLLRLLLLQSDEMSSLDPSLSFSLSRASQSVVLTAFRFSAAAELLSSPLLCSAGGRVYSVPLLFFPCSFAASFPSPLPCLLARRRRVLFFSLSLLFSSLPPTERGLICRMLQNPPMLCLSCACASFC